MIVGDPDGMRALADDLSRHAGKLRDATGDVHKAFGKIEFKGPFADDCKKVVEPASKGFSTAAEFLDTTVKLLRSAATQVEEQIEAERRRLEAIERERQEAAARAQAAAAAEAQP